MKIVAVAGGSGCGKTLFSELLTKRLPESVVLPLDCYYLDRPDDVPIGEYNFDSPNAFDFDLYNLHLDELFSGKPIQKPKFSWESGKRRYVTVGVP